MATLGYAPIVGTNAFDYATVGTANSVNQRAYVSARMPEDGWAYQMNVRGGSTGVGIPRVALGVWANAAETAPGALLGRTAEFTTGTAMLDRFDGTVYTRALQTAVKLRSNFRYAPGFNVNDAAFGYGTRPRADLPAGEVYDVWRRTVASGPTPQDPFGYTSVGVDSGWIGVWLDYEPNVAPDVPSDLAPVSGASVQTLTPTFHASFRDDNETLPNGLAGDKLGSVQIQVRIVGTTSYRWNYTYNADASEQNLRRFSVVYAGTTLVVGTPYEWRCRVADDHGAWSEFTSFQPFTVGAGFVDTSSGTPSLKQETRTPGPFTAIWQHNGGTQAEAVQVEITNRETGAVVRAMDPIWQVLSPPVSVGGTLSITWAQTGFGPLDWGGLYSYRMRVEDFGSVVSGWSDARDFRVNAAPTIPTIVAPLNGAVTSTRPELVVTSTDADSDDLAGAGHVVNARIKDSAGTVLFTRLMTYDAVTATFRYQTTSTDLATTGDYRWDAWAHDGTVYSGGNTVLGAGAMSTEQTFTYSSGPSVTHTTPADGAVVNTDTPVYGWTTTNQIRFRVRVFDVATNVMIYDTGEVTDSTTNHRQRAGYIDNGGSYYRIVDVWNNLNQQGTSSAAFFTVNYTAGNLVNNFTASPYRARHDVTPTAVLLSWDQTSYTSGQFQSYVITRRAVADTEFDVDDEIQSEVRRIAIITNPANTTYVDYLPASGVSYVYGIRQVVEVDEVTITSNSRFAEIVVDFQETVICDAQRGGQRRALFQARDDRETRYEREQKVIMPWGTSKPSVLSTNRWNRVISGVFMIVADTPVEAETMVREIERLHQRGGPHCYRDGRGRRYFGEITAARRIDPPGGRTQRVEIEFLQTNAHEVVA